jgi:hypothetical protein
MAERYFFPREGALAYTAYSVLSEAVNDELAHDLFQLVFAYQLMSDQQNEGVGSRALDEPAQRDARLACALRSYGSLLRQVHRDRDAAMVLAHAQALMSTP